VELKAGEVRLWRLGTGKGFPAGGFGRLSSCLARLPNPRQTKLLTTDGHRLPGFGPEQLGQANEGLVISNLGPSVFIRGFNLINWEQKPNVTMRPRWVFSEPAELS
jgi:hypothetical protein